MVALYTWPSAQVNRRLVVQPKGMILAALRFFVSMYIVIYHMLVVAPWDMRAVSPVFSKGWIGTDFFIILSGFIIALAYKSRLETGKLAVGEFMLGRVLRLWPPHAVVLAFFLIYVLITKTAGFGTSDPSFFAASSFLSQFFLTNSFIFAEHAWNVPTWTLSALVVCYMLYAIAAPQLARMKEPRILLAVSVLWLLSASALAVAATGKSIANLSEHLALIRAIPLFFFGALLGHYALLQRSHSRSQDATRYLTIILATMLVIAHLWSDVASDTIILLLTAGVVLFAVEMPVGKVMHTLGRLSFAIYLIHVPLIYVYFPFIRRIGGLDTTDVPYVALWLAFPCVVVVAAYLFEKWVEAPLADITRRVRSQSLQA